MREETYRIKASTLRIIDDALGLSIQWLNVDAQYTHSQSNILALKNKIKHASSLLVQDIRDDISRKVSKSSKMARESNTDGTLSSGDDGKGGKVDNNTDS